ncbi:Uncharacterised protein [Vibrio cholerae]|nr:Uncharacterised protein [Vibrio cholerae]
MRLATLSTNLRLVTRPSSSCQGKQASLGFQRARMSKYSVPFWYGIKASRVK